MIIAKCKIVIAKIKKIKGEEKDEQEGRERFSYLLAVTLN